MIENIGTQVYYKYAVKVFWQIDSKLFWEISRPTYTRLRISIQSRIHELTMINFGKEL